MLPQIRGPNLQLSLAIALSRSYIEQGVDLASQNALVDVGVRLLGFLETEIRTCLDGDDCGENPASVLTFIFQDRYVHPGWSDAGSLLTIFGDLSKGAGPCTGAF